MGTALASACSMSAFTFIIHQHSLYDYGQVLVLQELFCKHPLKEKQLPRTATIEMHKAKKQNSELLATSETMNIYNYALAQLCVLIVPL